MMHGHLKTPTLQSGDQRQVCRVVRGTQRLRSPAGGCAGRQYRVLAFEYSRHCSYRCHHSCTSEYAEPRLRRLPLSLLLLLSTPMTSRTERRRLLVTSPLIDKACCSSGPDF
ncbi:hypothetical protein BDZ89DRAFT_831673 [Hymenopellis radicata]|nr:hypothetical protein BDZ89DRAFT_831673 [Hymenopellis radicata]